jgi:hypothetical protein
MNSIPPAGWSPNGASRHKASSSSAMSCSPKRSPWKRWNVRRLPRRTGRCTCAIRSHRNTDPARPTATNRASERCNLAVVLRPLHGLDATVITVVDYIFSALRVLRNLDAAGRGRTAAVSDPPRTRRIEVGAVQESVRHCNGSLKPTSHQNSTPTLPGATERLRFGRVLRDRARRPPRALGMRFGECRCSSRFWNCRLARLS